jgi:hypothetical protein
MEAGKGIFPRLFSNIGNFRRHKNGTVEEK